MNGALRDLLAERATSGGQDPPRVLATSELDAAHWSCAASVPVAADQLVRTLRRWKGEVRVVAAATVSPALLRALREHPPELLVLTGDATADQLTDLASIGGRRPLRLLGPHATFRAGEAGPLACATHRRELELLVAALGPVRAALCPVPAWLPDALLEAELGDADLVGYVNWEQLGLRWARWSESATGRNIIVPLGVEAPSLDKARQPALAQAVAVGALEAYTGPVYPAPRVIAAVHRGVDGDASGDAPGESARRLWRQARRALPRTGGLVGMEAPMPGLDISTPTAGFLAQRVLIHMASARACADLSLPSVTRDPSITEASVSRALTVLAGGGEVLSEHESKVVLRGFGVEITRQAVANSASGAAAFADRIGYPVVLKAVSPDLRRRSELGAVKLGLANAAAVKRGYAAVVHAVEEHAPMARLDGVVVAEMVESGVELRCGGLRMRGNEIAWYGQPVGLDTLVEPVFALASADAKQALLLAHAVLSRLPIPAHRRTSDPDVTTLARLYQRILRIFEETGDRLSSIDLCPIRLVPSARSYVTLDARIVQRAHLEGE